MGTRLERMACLHPSSPNVHLHRVTSSSDVLLHPPAEYAESMQLEIRKAEAQGQMVQRSKRRMPEVLTLENLREYALGLLTDGDIDQAEEVMRCLHCGVLMHSVLDILPLLTAETDFISLVQALHRVLQVDPEDVLSLFTLGELMHGTRADYIAAQSFYEQVGSLGLVLGQVSWVWGTEAQSCFEQV